MYEDFSDWVQDLLSEGYDLSDYTWDEMYNIYEETAEEKKKRIAARRARLKQLEQEGKVMTSSKRTSRMAAQRRQEKAQAEREAQLARLASEFLSHTGRVSERPMGSSTPAPKEAAPEANRRLPRNLRKDTLGKAADQVLKNEYEIYELVLDHLIEDGFVDNYDSAETMMNYMSEEWLFDILESKNWIQGAIKKPGALSR